MSVKKFYIYVYVDYSNLLTAATKSAAARIIIPGWHGSKRRI